MDHAEFSVGNTVRKVLHHIREEYRTAAKKTPEDTALSISKLVYQGQPRRRGVAPKSEADVDLKEDDPDDPDSFARSLKPVLMEAVQDVFDELETVYDNISKSAKDHIHSECVPAEPLSCHLSLITGTFQRDYTYNWPVNHGGEFPQGCRPLSQFHRDRR